MDNKRQENGALGGPLIFTLPAFSFVVILSFDWLDGRPGSCFRQNARPELSGSSAENGERIRERVLNEGRQEHGFRRSAELDRGSVACSLNWPRQAFGSAILSRGMIK